MQLRTTRKFKTQTIVVFVVTAIILFKILIFGTFADDDKVVAKPKLFDNAKDAVFQHVSQLLEHEIDITSPWILSYFTRLHSDMYMYLDTLLPSGITSDVIEEGSEKEKFKWFVQKTGEKVYPWLKTPVRRLHKSFKHKRAIVYTTGRRHSFYTYVSIKTIRDLGCTSDIVIVYGGDGDLPPDHRAVLRKLPGVSFLDITSAIDWEIAKPEGWAIKPFALLMAPYQEVMFIDSDVFFLKNPDFLFEDIGYKTTGTLFFHDRTLFPTKNAPSRVWFSSIVPDLSHTAQKLRIMRGETQHEQESGVVVIDKKKSLLGLLATCSLNTKKIRDSVVYQKIHGDKETFWMGYEMARIKYTFMPGFGGAIGSTHKVDFNGLSMTCGGLLHTDRQGDLLWFNGGLEVEKNSKKGMVSFKTSLMDKTGIGVNWLFGEKSPNGFCLHIEGHDEKELSEQNMKITQNMLKRYEEAKAEAADLIVK